MNNTILRNKSGMLFETHTLQAPTLPFRYHRQIVHRYSVLNIHENLEFLFFLEGEGRILLDGAASAVRAGDIAAINSYTAHQVVTDGELTQFCLIVDSSFCQYNSIDPTRLDFRPVIQDSRAQELFRQVMDVCTQPESKFGYTAIKCSVLNLVLYLCQSFSTPRQRPLAIGDSAMSYVCAATQYINENLSARLTAQSVSTHVGVSKYHFLRLFKRLTGVTLSHYINALRCERARQLLEQGEYKIKEAACLCGFSNLSYFSRTFRQHIGMLPSQINPK